MKERTLDENSRGPAAGLYYIVAVLLLLYAWPANAYAQTADGNSERSPDMQKQSVPQAAASLPFLTEYREIKIGAAADTLRDAWGKPKLAYPDGFLYEISDSETIQIAIDPEQKITTISVTFTDGKGAPSFAEVFGNHVELEKGENGSVYKMVRYTEAGYWVAYSAGPAENATVTVTMQKL